MLSLVNIVSLKNTHDLAMIAFLSGSYVVFMYNTLNKIFDLSPLISLYEICSKSFITFCIMREWYCTSIPCKLWLIEGSHVCRTVAESLPYVDQATCCVSFCKRMFVTFGDASECRL
jgi:hypothetical protein